MSTTTTSNGNSILAVAPAVFPTVLINPGAELSNAHEFSANNVRAVQNPLGWPTDYRRVPNYRPTNTILDMTERPYGANRIGWLVGHFLTTGVIIQSSFTKAWESTGYRWWPGLTMHKTGGEW